MVLEQVQDFEPFIEAKLEHFETVTEKLLLNLKNLETSLNEATKLSQKDKVTNIYDDISKRFSYFKLFSHNFYEFETKSNLNPNHKKRVSHISKDIAEIKNFFANFNSLQVYTENINEKNEVDSDVIGLTQINQDNALLQRQMEVENLSRDLHLVEKLGKELADSILEQGMKVDSIENNSYKSFDQITKGENSLRKTVPSFLKVIGPGTALVSGIILGAPIYAVAGVTAGIISGITGATVGYFQGNKLKKNLLNKL